MTKIVGSGNISQRHGSADPDPYPYQNAVDPQHCFQLAAAQAGSALKTFVVLGVGGGVAGGNPRKRGRDQALPHRNHGGPSQGMFPLFVY